MTWYINGIENSFLKSFSNLIFESYFPDEDPANYYPAVMVVTIVGVAFGFAILIWWLERKTRERDGL